MWINDEYVITYDDWSRSYYMHWHRFQLRLSWYMWLLWDKKSYFYSDELCWVFWWEEKEEVVQNCSSIDNPEKLVTFQGWVVETRLQPAAPRRCCCSCKTICWTKLATLHILINIDCKLNWMFSMPSNWQEYVFFKYLTRLKEIALKWFLLLNI